MDFAFIVYTFVKVLKPLISMYRPVLRMCQCRDRALSNSAASVGRHSLQPQAALCSGSHPGAGGVQPAQRNCTGWSNHKYH